MDAGLLAIVAISSLWGAWRGMLRSVYGLAAFAAAFWMAKSYAPAVFLRLVPDGFVGSPPFLLASSYMLVFFGVLIPLMLLARLLRAMMDKLDLNALDRTAGFVFGFLRGLLIAFIGVIMLSFVPFIDKEMLQKSSFLPAAGSALRAALKWNRLEKYARYWRFDDNGAPVFDAKVLAEDAVMQNYLPEGVELPEGIELPESIKPDSGGG